MNHASRPPPTDFDGNLDAKSLSLIRRTLCSSSPPTTPLSELLPALTSSTAVDAQLYVLISILLREFVQSWYAQITSDEALTEEIVALLAHCTRALEERARRVDWDTLLLDEAPAILQACIEDYRLARTRAHSALAPESSAPDLFLRLHPHPVTTDQHAYTQLLATGLLALLLPTEDLESTVERTLLTAIISDIVLATTIDKLSEPWVLYDLLLTLLARDTPPAPPRDTATLILDTLATAVSSAGWLLTQLHTLWLQPPPPPPKPRPALAATSALAAAASLLGLSAFQPWLTAAGRLLAIPFRTRAHTPGRLLDDLLAAQITPLITEERVVALLKTARRALFPGDVLAAGREPPDEAGCRRLREECEKRLREVLPGGWARGAAEACEALADREVNRVVVVRVLEGVLGRVFPELAETGAADVLRERMGM